MEENVQKYEFEKDKKIYILTMSIIDREYLKIICKPKNQNHRYINQFSKDDLIKINPIFSYFDNIQQIQAEFDKCVLSAKVTVIHNRTLFDIYFYIKNKQNTEKIALNLIYENELNTINKNKNKNYKDILSEIEMNINNIKKEQKIMNNKINQTLSENNNNNNYILNKTSDNNIKNGIYFNENKLKLKIKSDIIKSIDEYNLIKNKLLSKRKYKINHNINYILLYKASLDTDNAKIFHQKCDSKKNTLILIETTQGTKFGGFTTQTWVGEDINKKDENAFLFSLDKLKIYDIIKDSDAITCSTDFGPIFCGNQILINDNFFKNGGRTGKAFMNYNTENDYELNNGNIIFGIKELEVFEIIFQ